MIGDYLVVTFVFGIAGSFVFMIHHFWLRNAFKEEFQQSAPTKSDGTCKVAARKTSPERKPHGLSQTQVPGTLSKETAAATLTTIQLTSGARTGSESRVMSRAHPRLPFRKDDYATL